LDIYEKVLQNELSVRATEALIRNLNASKGDKGSVEEDETPKYIKKGINVFSEYFGHKIDVKVSKNGKGKITIPFHSEEDFVRIKKLIQGAK
jgi:ParB family chromosome partitioning protein